MEKTTTATNSYLVNIYDSDEVTVEDGRLIAFKSCLLLLFAFLDNILPTDTILDLRYDLCLNKQNIQS